MPKRDPELCQKIRDRVDKWEKYWTINRSLYYEWIDFVMGDQWREDESKLFERYNKIPLIFNKLGVLMNHLLAEQIMNTPNLQIMPEEDVPVEIADVRAALVKNISLNSDAKSVYQQSFWQAVVGGYGGYHINHRYLNNFSFDQEIYLESHTDPNQYYWDISARTRCKVDGMFAGYKTRISRTKFRDKWGVDIESQVQTTANTEDSTISFADDDSVTIVDDFEKEKVKITIYQLSNMEIIDDQEFKKLDKTKTEAGTVLIRNGLPVTVLQKRSSIKYKIRHRQIAGDFVLEEEDFPTDDLLPVVFVDMKSYYTKSGQQITRSFFKDAKDPQKYLNYLATQSAYIMKISRYDQFIMPRKCAANPDTQQQWRDPSVVRGALYYDETPSGAKPEKLAPPELSQSLTTEYQRTLMDIQSGTGMYNTQLGEMGNEVSGTAIDARTQRGSRNTYLPFDSLNKAIAVGGEIINEMIPKLYDSERTLILSMQHSENAKVEINKPMDEYGIQVQNDMRKGRYKIRLKPGPSYEGEKQEALLSLQTVLQADRQGTVFPMIADLYAENLPLDNNLEIRNRLRTIVPPEIIQAGKTGQPLPPKPQQPSPDMIKVQLQQAELQQKEQAAQRDYEMKLRELQIKEAEVQRKAIESHRDMSVAFEKLQSEREQAAAKLQETLLRYQAEEQRVGADMHIAHGQNLVKILTHHPKNNKEVTA